MGVLDFSNYIFVHACSVQYPTLFALTAAFCKNNHARDCITCSCFALTVCIEFIHHVWVTMIAITSL